MKPLDKSTPCHCPPDKCEAPVVMGQQTPCRRGLTFPNRPIYPKRDALFDDSEFVHAQDNGKQVSKEGR